MAYFERIVVFSFVTISVLLGFDLYSDFESGSSLLHVLQEGTALTVSFIMISIYLLRFYGNVVADQKSLISNIKNIQEDRDRWRIKSESYLSGLGKIIDEQFEYWNLSESEKEVGLLILKGMTHKEIANIRETSEKTVRQQAASLYSKAGMENKSQLSAFFLEDLLLPRRD